jgi:2-oxo-3-hexenedioate decarboxylase
MTSADITAIADRLLGAFERAGTIDPISATVDDFDMPAAYAVLEHIAARRVADGWESVGRKIGFTNTKLWDLYGVDRPMWAHVWSKTVVHVTGSTAELALDHLVQPRIEPEVVFKLGSRPPSTADPVEVLHAVEWMAPGFEIVHCHFPGWRFTLADCTADFALHGALVVGTPVVIDGDNLEAVAEALTEFELTLSRDEAVIDRGVGTNVLGGPAHALTHLIRVLDDGPESSRLQAGETITTGTVTDAWPIQPGERWTSDYGALGLEGLTLVTS